MVADLRYAHKHLTGNPVQHNRQLALRWWLLPRRSTATCRAEDDLPGQWGANVVLMSLFIM